VSSRNQDPKKKLPPEAAALCSHRGLSLGERTAALTDTSGAGASAFRFVPLLLAPVFELEVFSACAPPAVADERSFPAPLPLEEPFM